MRVTIKEVAKLAGVSPSTVSRVLTDHPKISQATKDKVWKVMKELDYHPNVTARKLATNATRTIGLVLPSDVKLLAENPFFIQVLTGITSYAQAKGYYILLTNAETREGEIEALNHLFRSNLIDGVIMTVVREADPCVEYLKVNNHPYAVIGKPHDTDSALWVDNDNFQAMYEMVNYLLKQGNQKIAFIGGSNELTVTKNRKSGYEMALTNRGLHLDEALVRDVTFSEAAGYEAAQDLLNKVDIDAIATTDDLIAVGALQAIKDAGRDDITITGFNNTPIGHYQDPPLLTVDINAVELGHYAAKLLIEKLTNTGSGLNSYIVDTKLIKN
jgi:DNA-binding LacI/PurR family transcriptional regulator